MIKFTIDIELAKGVLFMTDIIKFNLIKGYV